MNDTRPQPADRDAKPESLAPTENVLACIHVVSNLIGRAYHDEVASKWDLTLPEWRIMLTLMHQPGASASEITELWGMEKMAVSRGTRRLESMGRVARTVHADDRRRFTLRLTPAGEALYRKVEPGATQRYREIMAVLTRAERKTLQGALTRLIRHIATLDG